MTLDYDVTTAYCEKFDTYVRTLHSKYTSDFAKKVIKSDLRIALRELLRCGYTRTQVRELQKGVALEVIR